MVDILPNTVEVKFGDIRVWGIFVRKALNVLLMAFTSLIESKITQPGPTPITLLVASAKATSPNLAFNEERTIYQVICL